MNREIGINIDENGVYSAIGLQKNLRENLIIRKYFFQTVLGLLYGLLFFVPIGQLLYTILNPDSKISIFSIIVGILCGVVTFIAVAGIGVEAGVGFGLGSGVSLGMGMSLSESVQGFSYVNFQSGAIIGVVVGAFLGLIVSLSLRIYDRLSSIAAGSLGGMVLAGIIFGMSSDKEVAVLIGLSYVAAFCFSSSITIGSLGRSIVGHVHNLAVSVIAGVTCVLLADLKGVDAVNFGLIIFLTALPISTVTYFRLMLYIPYAFINLIIYVGMLLYKKHAFDIYRYSPVNWDEIIWLPIPYLDSQLILLSRIDLSRALEVIRKIASSFRQSWAAKSALEIVGATKMENVSNLYQLSNLPSDLSWLPTFGSESLDQLIKKFCQELKSALMATSNYNRLARFNRAQSLLTNLEFVLAKTPRKIALVYARVFEIWRKLLQDELRNLTAESKTSAEIPNPFIPGAPIHLDEGLIFFGRTDVFAEIENSLSVKFTPPTLLLYGPRRSGKTSLLYQLPSRLSTNIIPVFINLQELAGTVFSSNGFINALREAIVNQCKDRRGLSIPTTVPDSLDQLFDDEPFLGFSAWLRQIAPYFAEATLFIMFDEFEWVENAISSGRLDQRVLSFFRNLIQQDYRIRLAILFAGVHTMEELKYDWPSYFINVRSIKVGNLPVRDAKELITNPVMDFPVDYSTDALTKFIELTNCQPYLIQLISFELINYLNSYEKRVLETNPTVINISLEDLLFAVEKALGSGYNYFAEQWTSSSATEQSILSSIANSSEVSTKADILDVDLSIRRLMRRDIIIKDTDGKYRFQIPLVQEWIRREKSSIR